MTIPRPSIHAFIPAAIVALVLGVAVFSCSKTPSAYPPNGLPSTLTSPDFRGFGSNVVNVGHAENLNNYQFAAPLTKEQEELYAAIQDYNRKSK